MQFTQKFLSPSVYLDHWALLAISESDRLSSRLCHALKLSGGTLALSWLNVVEFTKVTDESQRHKADILLNSVTPNVFWLNPDLLTVAKHERLAPSLARSEAPYSDLEMAELFIASGLYRSASAQILAPQSHFVVIQCK